MRRVAPQDPIGSMTPRAGLIRSGRALNNHKMNKRNRHRCAMFVVISIVATVVILLIRCVQIVSVSDATEIESTQQHMVPRDFHSGSVTNKKDTKFEEADVKMYNTASFVAKAGKVAGNISIVSRRMDLERYHRQPYSLDTVCGGEQRNAIVILAQKKHSTYGRDSYGLLLQALQLFSKNYLSIADHAKTVDLFLFHTGDFDYGDIQVMEETLTLSQSNPNSATSWNATGFIKLVNLVDSSYWSLPPWHARDNQTHWVDSKLFPIGYRHMCRWFGVKIWQFFSDVNQNLGCNYRYLLRLDEDSFIHSPINYDIFNFMSSHGFVYGYRLCAYEMDYNLRYIGNWFHKWQRKIQPQRYISRDICGFYNNFFVADLNFFTSRPVQKYLKDIDRQGFIYRIRYGDLMLHTTAVYAFAKQEQVHRFLSFTYEHVTLDHVLHPEQGCVVWGGIQAGWDDPNAEETLGRFYKERVLDRNCTANVTYLSLPDLSPSYQHVPDNMAQSVRLKTIMAGKVELPNQGILSG